MICGETGRGLVAASQATRLSFVSVPQTISAQHAPNATRKAVSALICSLHLLFSTLISENTLRHSGCREQGSSGAERARGTW